MVITYFGKSYFKLTLGDLTIALNPISKDSKDTPKPSRFGADIALISVNHPDFNGIETVALGDKEPFVLDSAGSYEVKGLFFTGASSLTTVDNKEYRNTVYGFELDGIKICFLGEAYDEKALSAEAKELATDADLIFVSLASDPARAYKNVILFDPNIIIPMNYSSEQLGKFLKESSQNQKETFDKLTLKRKDLEGKDGMVMVLTSQA